jgi:hypothetical protein
MKLKIRNYDWNISHKSFSIFAFPMIFPKKVFSIFEAVPIRRLAKSIRSRPNRVMLLGELESNKPNLKLSLFYKEKNIILIYKTVKLFKLFVIKNGLSKNNRLVNVLALGPWFYIKIRSVEGSTTFLM